MNQYHRARRVHGSVQSDESLLEEAAAPLRTSLTAAQATVEPDVEAALSGLLPDFRAAVLLVDVEALSYEEAADVLVCPLGTVRSRLFRARKFLSNRLREWISARERWSDWSAASALLSLLITNIRPPMSSVVSHDDAALRTR